MDERLNTILNQLDEIYAWERLLNEGICRGLGTPLATRAWAMTEPVIIKLLDYLEEL